MRDIKIAAGLAHVDYGHLADIVQEATDGGADYIHSDAADMHDLKNMQLMGGHQIVEGIRPHTDRPIEVPLYSRDCDRLFVEKIAAAGANMLIVPAEHFIGAPLAYLINYCREFGMKIGLAVGCYTPLMFVDEAVYDIDRIQVVIHGVDETDGKDNWGWRRSSIDLVKRARALIEAKNPKCEQAVDGGLRHNNLAPMVEAEPDVMIFSSAIFKDPDGPAEGVRKCRRAIEEAQAALVKA